VTKMVNQDGMALVEAAVLDHNNMAELADLVL
jgi:hypothetical protein